MKPSKVFGMIMLETIFLSLTGAVIGVAVSIASVSFFGHTGINLSIIAEGFNALGYSSIVYPTLGVKFYIHACDHGYYYCHDCRLVSCEAGCAAKAG